MQNDIDKFYEEINNIGFKNSIKYNKKNIQNSKNCLFTKFW